MALKINKIKTTLKGYPWYIVMGIPKVGKTTFFRDLVLHYFDNDPTKGALFSFGQEEGHEALDELNCEKVYFWDDDDNPLREKLVDEDGNEERGWIQIVDWLIEKKGIEHNIEMIGIDTIDQYVEVVTPSVLQEHKDKTGNKVDSLNEALGGFQRGQKRAVEKMTSELHRLHKAGFIIFLIGHTKQKEQTDVLTDIAFDKITNNLSSTFYDPFANGAQMIVNIVQERVFEDIHEEKIGNTNKKKTVGTELEVQRMMYFRGNPAIDAGGRFNGLPDKLPLSVDNFMKAFQMGVENSRLDLSKPRESSFESEAKIIERDKKNLKSLQKEIENTQNSAEETEIKKDIWARFQTVKTDSDVLSKFKDLLIKHGIKPANLKLFDDVPLAIYREIEEIIKK